MSISRTFWRELRLVVNTCSIPKAMIINLDETGLSLVPVFHWMLEQQGAATVTIAGVDNKREITTIVAASIIGDLLPLQLLYTGTTERCHPSIVFPNDCDSWYSSDHWANKTTTMCYIDKILKIFLQKKRQELELANDHKALFLWDVCRAHRTPPVLEKVTKENIEVVFTSANCTSEL